MKKNFTKKTATYKFFIFHFSFFIFFTFHFQTFAQNVLVLDNKTNKPIEHVVISAGNEYTFTNQNGIADISKFANAEKITFSHPAYFKDEFFYSELKDKNFEISLVLNENELDQITISANRWEQDISEVPVKIAFIDIKSVNRTNPQTAADLLAASGEIFIQKSQMGGGSPMIRGFAANRVLIVVDGVRMNNAIYRSGNLQNVISLDANSLQQAEVILGPGSVIYGSDAIGGVMDFHTKVAQLSTNDKLRFTANYLTRYSSANQEKTGHLDFSLGSKKLAMFSSITYSDFGDLRMGTVGHNEYQRPEFVETIDGKDSILQNSAPNVQKHSAYSQVNLMQKFRYKPNRNWDFNYAFHHSQTSDVPRYDRLIEYSDDKLKSAEWYYGPQKWQMQNLTVENYSNAKLFDNTKLTLAYQDYTESRNDRKFGKTEIRKRTENVKVASANLDFDKEINEENHFFYGLEAVHNIVSSDGILENITSGETETYASRYPDGSTYSSASAYLQYKHKFDENLTLNIGSRYSYTMLKADFDTTFYKFPFSKIESNIGALSGSVGLSYSTENNWQFNLNLATGFRSPNIDDVGKVFDSEPGNVIVPNPNLKAEYIYSGEIGVVKRSENLFFEVVGFYSLLDDAMVRGDFSFAGQDSIMYDGELSKVEALVNTDQAVVFGGQVAVGVEFLKHFELKTNYTYTKGYDKEKNPLRHVSPNFGATHLYFDYKKVFVDFYSQYNSEISYDNLAHDEQDKPHIYATDSNGNPYSPSWWTLNLKTSVELKKFLVLNAGVENILDHRYRPYSSGIVAPGRNFIVSISGRL